MYYKCIIYQHESIFRVEIIQNGKMVVMMDWNASQKKMIKVYKPDKPSDWSGIHWHGNTTMVPHDVPKCGWNRQWCETLRDSNKTIVTILIISGSIIILLIIGAVLCVKKYRYEALLKEDDKIIIPWAHLSDVQIEGANEESDERAKYRHKPPQKVKTAVYQQEKVILKHLRQTNIDYQNREILVKLHHMQELVHENICAFVGIFTDAEHMCIVMSYEPRGSLRDIIQDEMFRLSWDFKRSIILDLAKGLRYLHHSQVGYHGTLTSSKCVIDNRWTCKITGYGLHQIHSTSRDVHLYQLGEENKYYKLLWVAPELLEAVQQGQVSGTKKGDTYSLGIIMQEVILEAEPYAANEPRLSPQVIIQNLREGQSLRPAILAECCCEGWAHLMEACWRHDPDQRADAGSILHTILSINKGKSMALVDNMLKRLEFHAEHLEERVADKTRDLLEEKSKLDILLSELLPQSIVNQLIRGTHIEPEAFDNVTLLFSDIVGFTRISSEAMPLDIVKMLNSMYSLFDDITHQFDVYKVATIGDAYMVTSGVPIRNGDKHATEICKLAITLVDCIKDIAIPHIPEEHLQVRIGIHSGPCVAGVAGIKMPRYQLFGDTVDIAARMESRGKAMKIHISETTERLVKVNDIFCIEEHGILPIPGKGNIATYWIT